MNEVTNFMYYMYNKWNDSEATALFGKNLGAHIFEKWQHYNGRALEWYGALDTECRQKVADRANEIYGK